MTLRKQILALLLALMLVPAFAFAQEKKKATVESYDSGSRMVVLKGKGWEVKAKVSSSVAAEKGDLLKKGAKVTVQLEDRGGGDVRVRGIDPR